MMMRLASSIVLFSIAAALLVTVCSYAGPIVPFGSTWKYLDDGSNQSNAWFSVDYEDDGWAAGPAQLGYGDGDEATEVSFGTNGASKYITTYFRLVFNVPDTNAFTNLVLNLIRDDGAIVYLNGVEVFRSAMPSGAVNYLTRASAGGENTLVSTNLSPVRLVNGANLLAVEVHQDSASSSDISFDLELTDGRNDSPTVSISSPGNNETFPGQGDVIITVNAIDPNGVITNVQFFAGNVLLGNITNAPYAIIWSNVPSGAHIISATARDDDGLLSASKPVRFLVGSGGLSNLVLVPQGASWKYLDDGSNQGAEWRSNDFDDATWANGLAQFGYGDSDEVTLVNFGGVSTNKYITTYFRKSFAVTDTAHVSALVLRLLRDDGAIVYLNGQEVFRSNMPAGAVDYLTEAISNLGSPAEDTFLRTNLNVSALISGTNVLAVEIHQASRTSGDLSFDLELLGSDLPSVLRGPWLQSVSWSNAIVSWRTDVKGIGQVQFGTNVDDLDFSITSAAATNEHRLALTNLAPGTKYFYSIGLTNMPLLSGPDYYVITPPLPGTSQPMRFWALGDCGTADVNQFNVRDAFQRMNGINDLDALLLLGDNAYNAGLDAEYQRAIFDVYPATLRKTPVWSTIGNHETDQSSSPPSTIAYYQIFNLPRAGEVGGVASGTEDYYSFDYGNVHFVCLDSMTSSRSGTGTMANWLRADLDNTTQDWLIAFWHHPPYTKGSHNSDTETALTEMRQNLLPILEAYGVDLVLCGHSHAYERTDLIDGHYGLSSTLSAGMVLNSDGGRPDGAGAYVKPAGLNAHQGAVYVVAGSAGKVSGGSLNHPAMFLSLNRLGSLYFEVNGHRLDATFLRENGATNDNFTIIKGNAITVADTTVAEGDTEITNAVFTFTLSQTSSVPVTVSYITSSEGALADVDFSSVSGVITFDAGSLTQTVTVPIIGDPLVESNETFALNLAGTPLLTRLLARGTIVDNDSGSSNVIMPRFSSVICTNGIVVLRWPTIAGRTYRVEYNEDLNADTWMFLPEVIDGDGNLYTFMDNATTNTPRRFYRVSVE